MILHNASSLAFRRFYSAMQNQKSLVVGLYNKKSDGVDKTKSEIKLTSFGDKFNEKLSAKLQSDLKSALGDQLGCGQTRVLYNVSDEYKVVCVAGLGDASSWDSLDEINGARENVRIASAAGVKALQALKLSDIYVEPMDSPMAAAEGAVLATYKFQAYKEESKKSKTSNVHFAGTTENQADFEKGRVYANAQNFARVLMETPANFMTPTIFCDTVKEKCAGLANLKIEAHDEEWAKKENMNLFLSVSAGGHVPPKFLEITYSGGDKSQKYAALVGKGITFDSGGISIKPSAKMDQMRADMGGAANVASCIYALAELKVPINVRGFIPLCENMPGRCATKPGDVIYGRSGKSVCIDNTDAEGRLVLADAISYANDFNPKFILDIATLTGAVRVALGDCVTAIYSTKDDMWNMIHESGKETGDRVWRMPLYKHYANQMTEHDGYDLNNLGKGKGGGSCTAAAFLREFVNKDIPWLHADIAGVMCETSDQPYISASMSGRPVRTLIDFVIREGTKQ